MSVRTNSFIEENLYKVANLINAQKDPKWVPLRFALFISLSLNEPLEHRNTDNEFRNGKIYPLEVITGKGKGNEDYTDFIAFMIMNNDNIEITNDKELVQAIENHIIRGFDILLSSLNKKSNLYGWLITEFYKKDSHE